MTEPYKQPRNLNKGRIVIFRGTPRKADEPIGERPAIVQKVHDETLVDLYPFFIASAPGSVFRVPYSLAKVPYSWCWVDEQDMTAQDV